MLTAFQKFGLGLANELERSAMSKASDYACKYRIMGPPIQGNWSFKYHPWLIQPHDDPAEEICAQKAAQLGWTEWMLNRMFYTIDILRQSAMYVLPSKKPDCENFNNSRIVPAQELSPHLNTLFQDVSNAFFKRHGSANLLLMGSQKKSQLCSNPVPNMFFDELDQMVQENIVYALERTSGQFERRIAYISTATLENYGINKLFRRSDQKHFFFKCPCCGRMIRFEWPDSLVVWGDDPDHIDLEKSYYICTKCKGKLNHQDKHIFLQNWEWVPKFNNRRMSGYHVDQMYSSTVPPHRLAEYKLRAETNPFYKMELFNQKLGLTYSEEGAKITDEDIDECTKEYVKKQFADLDTIYTMGVDQGARMHYEIKEWKVAYGSNKKDYLDFTLGRVVAEGNLPEFEDLDHLMSAYKIHFCVIDHQPETRKAEEFAARWSGKVLLCHFNNTAIGSVIRRKSDYPMITVDRTYWFDTILARVKKRTAEYPANLSQEYKDHIKAPTRTYTLKDNRPVGVYVSNEPDHLALACLYNELAFVLYSDMAVVEYINAEVL